MKRRIAGVDGCTAGWIAIAEDGRAELAAHCLDDAARLFDWARAEGIEALAVDIPIGLPDDTEPRACDQQARQRIGSLRSSVFPAPVRAVLQAGSYREACDLNRERSGKGLSRQAWNIVPRIRAVDAMMTPEDQVWCREVHPEVSFAAWHGEPLGHAKRTPAGQALRENLINRDFGGDARRRLLEQFPRREVGVDDLYDAFAALWSARRIADGSARSLPDDPPHDARGLHMAIWY